MADHAPSFPLTRLFRKTSKEGKTYFTGRLGGARIALLKSKETADDGGEIWTLLISEAPKPRESSGERQDSQDQQGPPRNAYAQATERQGPSAGGWPSGRDESIPFAPVR